MAARRLLGGVQPEVATTADHADHVRRLGPDDAALLAALVARCSARTLAARFHRAHGPDAAAAVASLSALLAERTQLGIVVEGHLAACGGLVPVAPRRAEAAVLVADPWQGRGLGRLLLRAALTDRSWPGGEVVVHLQLENGAAVQAARAVLAELAGPHVVRRRDHGVLELEAAIGARSTAPEEAP